MATRRKLMVLGAGIYQLPLIRRAREMDLEVVVASYPGPYPGFAEADRVVYVDTTDAEGILAAAKSEGICGIITTGTDVAVRSLGRVCDTLGLPGISERAALNVTDKARMKQVLRAGGVHTSPFEVVRTLEEARNAAASIGYPVMVKACDVSGSRGVTKVTEPAGLAPAFDAACAATHKDYVIVEGFVAGYEIGVDGYVCEGALALFAPHDKFVAHFGDVTVPSGHAFPLSGDQVLRDRVREQLERCIAVTGMQRCAVNGDFIVAPDGSVHVIEVGGRCGATCIPELVSLHTGIDYYEQMILGALGDAQDVVPRIQEPCMAKLLFSRTDAHVKSVDEERLDDLRVSTGAKVVLDVRQGDAIHAAHDGTDRWGHVIMATDSETVLDETIEQVRQCITLC